MNIRIRTLAAPDVTVIANAFDDIGWSAHKPLSQYEQYLEQQQKGHRLVLVAFIDEVFAGYVTIVWDTEYAPFKVARIPEVKDFNVLPSFRRQKVGTALMDMAESLVFERSTRVGIGVGMYGDYGNAQRLYVKRGYVPDGRGLTYAGEVLEPGARTVNDDDLVLFFTKEIEERA